jgi:hypothetical protein
VSGDAENDAWTEFSVDENTIPEVTVELEQRVVKGVVIESDYP